MAYSTFSEVRINGFPVDWGYWYILQNIPPAYGAALAYRIDPLKTKKSDNVKAIQKELQEHITRLELRLASISPSWTLTKLIIFLGDDAPEGMLYQVRTQLHKALINLLRQLTIPKPLVLEDAGTVSQVQISEQPLGLKATKPSNDIDFSGLLNIPSKVDDWFRVIDDMTRGFYAKWGKMPNETQAWGALWKNPPEGYEITTGKDRGDDCLIMPGVTNLSKRGFSDRWKKYTRKKSG